MENSVQSSEALGSSRGRDEKIGRAIVGARQSPGRQPFAAEAHFHRFARESREIAAAVETDAGKQRHELVGGGQDIER